MCSNSCTNCRQECSDYVNVRSTWKVGFNDGGRDIDTEIVSGTIEPPNSTDEKKGWGWLLAIIPFLGGL